MILFPVLTILLLCPYTNSELLPSLSLEKSGYVSFKNETSAKTKSNFFSLYLKLDSASSAKQHIISLRSQTRTEQFIKVSLMEMRISVLANLRHPAVNRWFMVGEEFIPNKVYFISIEQSGTNMKITINDEVVTESLEMVEDFIFPAEILIGSTKDVSGISGSLAGLTYNGVSILHSYVRRDSDFENVAVEMGGEVSIREMEWITLSERNKKYCPHTNHFPKNEVGTEILMDNCPQNIARAVCAANQVWLIERCGDKRNTVVVRPGDQVKRGDGTQEGGIPKKQLLIYVGTGAAVVVLATLIVVVLLIKRSRKMRVHRYKMTKSSPEYADPDTYTASFPGRLQGISTLPPLKNDSLTTKPPPLPRRNSLEFDCSDIMDSRVPVFTATANPLGKPDDLYPVYMSSENAERDSDIISTILGEKSERNYTNHVYNSTNLIPSSLLNSNSGLNSEISWQDV